MTPVTLITGASAGLGTEFARQCAARGEVLALTARRGDRLERLKSALPVEAHIFPADLSQPGAATALLREIEAAGLHVSTLINNAGFGLAGAFATQPPDRQLEMVDLNIRALTELARAVLPAMLERGSGAILNLASTAAFQPGPGMAVYYASKAYVLSLTEAMHHELKGTGVKVSALCPGPTNTEFFDVAGVKGLLPRIAGDAESVVKTGLKALSANRAVAVAGLMNKVSAQGHRFLPRAAMRRIVGRIKAN